MLTCLSSSDVCQDLAPTPLPARRHAHLTWLLADTDWRHARRARPVGARHGTRHLPRLRAPLSDRRRVQRRIREVLSRAHPAQRTSAAGGKATRSRVKRDAAAVSSSTPRKVSSAAFMTPSLAATLLQPQGAGPASAPPRRSSGDHLGDGPVATGGVDLDRKALQIGRQAHRADGGIIRLGRTEASRMNKRPVRRLHCLPGRSRQSALTKADVDFTDNVLAGARSGVG